MPVYEGRGRRVLFVHIPKTGGTSIEVAFRRADFTQSYRSQSFTARGCRPQHLTATDLVEEFPGLPFDYVFAVVRDPVARFGSERVWRAGHAKKQGEPIMDFESFTSTWLDRYEADPTSGDNHFRPQVQFLLPQMDVFRFEDGMDWIMSRVAARLKVPRLGRAAPHRMRPRVEVDRSLDSLTAATRARLARLYLVDSVALGYPESFDPELPASGVAWRSPGDDLPRSDGETSRRSRLVSRLRPGARS
jgi:hypothetical protein